MKAILVFDVDNIDIENTQATYIELQCNNLTIQMALLNHWLKPMPDKIDQGYPCDAYEEGYGDGWDKCVDELQKEVENN